MVGEVYLYGVLTRQKTWPLPCLKAKITAMAFNILTLTDPLCKVVEHGLVKFY